MSDPARPDRDEQPQAAQQQPQAPANSDPDTGLSGFLDSLDERAKSWWARRKASREHARTRSAGPGIEESGHPGQQQLAKPPVADQRAEAPPATREFPPVSSPPQQSPVPPPLTADFPAADSAAHQVPSPAQPPPQPAEPSSSPVPAAQLDAAAGPATEPAAGIAQTPHSSAEQTMALPAYREDSDPSGTDHSEPVPNHAELEATKLAGAGSAPAAQPPRVRRALDEQRQRNVIVQKARAIEDATSGYGGYVYAEFADDEEDLYTYIPPYNLPSRDPDPEPTRWDLYRRIYVSIGALAALISTLWMFGVFTSPQSPAILSGNGLNEAYAQGWYSGDHALLSPDHNVYWLWPVITAGLIAHTGFQWTASQVSTPRQRRSGWLVGSASLLMLVVTASLYGGQFTLMTLASLAVAGLLVDAVREFNLYTARTQNERRLTDGIIGLFFGFALVQAMSALSVWLTVRGWEIPGVPALLWAAVGLFICVWTAAFYAMTERGRITIALGMGWGMFWLIFPRLLAEVTSVWVAIGAAMGAFIVILSTQSRRHRINHAERRAAMGRPLEDII